MDTVLLVISASITLQTVIASSTPACAGTDVNIKYSKVPERFSKLELYHENSNGTRSLIAEVGYIFRVYPPYNGRLFMSSNGDLKLKKVQVQDNGCFIRNVVGVYNNTEEIYLLVIEPPSGKPILRFRDEDRNLTCHVPEYKGNPEIMVSLTDDAGTKHELSIVAKAGKYKCCSSGKALECMKKKFEKCSSFTVNIPQKQEKYDVTITAIVACLAAVFGITVAILIITILCKRQLAKSKRNSKKGHSVEQEEIELLPKESGQKDTNKDLEQTTVQAVQALQIVSSGISGLFSSHSKPIDAITRDRLIDKSRQTIKKFLGQTQLIGRKAYHLILDNLRSTGVAVLIGLSGDGKTSLAYQMMKDMSNGIIQDLNKKQPFILSDPNEWYTDAFRSADLIIFIDDMFGAVNVTNVNEWKHILNEIEDVCTDINDPNRSLVLIALRIDIFENCPSSVKDHPVFKNNICDLTDKDTFPRAEKLEFLKRISLEEELTDIEETKIIEGTRYLGFPLCCNIFISETQIHKRRVDFFYEPIVFLKLLFLSLWDENRIHFGILALITLNGGQIHTDDFFDNHKTDVLKQFYKKGIPSNLSSNVLNSVHTLVGIYLSYNDSASTFSFLNNSIYNVVAAQLWESDCSKFIQLCSFDFLINIETDMTRTCYNPSFLLQESHFSDFANRIVREIRMKEAKTYKTVANLNIWKDQRFSKIATQIIIDQKVSLNKDDEFDNSLLHYAVGSRNIALVEILFGHNPSAMQCQKALNLSCKYGDMQLFTICKNRWNTVGIDTIFSTVDGGNEEIFQQLLHALNVTDKHESNKDDRTTTILQEICLHRNVNFLRLATFKMPSDRFQRLIEDQKLLYFATEGGSVDVIKYLVKNGADWHRKTKVHGTSLLQFGCGHGQLAAVIHLATYPGLLEAKDSLSLTALHYVATGTGSVEIVKFLVSKGLNIKERDNSGSTLFHLTCYRGFIRLAKYLFKEERDIIADLDSSNRTALHYCCMGTGSLAIASFLIENGINVQAQDYSGNTALDFAEMKNLEDVATIILERQNNVPVEVHV